MNIVKYPGGKEKELDIIREYLPSDIKDYYEPFVGGGAVYFDIKADHYYINDFSKDLINLYQVVADKDPEFFQSMKDINEAWKAIDQLNVLDLYNIYISYRNGETDDDGMTASVRKTVKRNQGKYIALVSSLQCGGYSFVTRNLNSTIPKKFKRMKTLEFTKKRLPDEDLINNIIGIFKSMFYMYIRTLYNHQGNYTKGFRAMLYLFIRDMCYSSMFRFNSNGEFNVPYGGISYNKKNYDKIFDKYQSDQILNRTSNTTFGNKDYKEFLEEHKPSEGDFMFLDPPYDSPFSTYDRNAFDRQKQEELAHYLLNECECNFLLDIGYTEFIASLYEEGTTCKNNKSLKIEAFDKHYSVSFKNRNNRQAEHLLIKNY